MTVLVDSSVWIEYLRDGPGPSADAVDHLIRSGNLATTDAVVLEILVGPDDEGEALRLTRLLGVAVHLAQESPQDAEAAAALHRACRRVGFVPRSRLDCLVAAVAIRNDVPVLHTDRDFDVIARHTDLRVLTP